MPKLATLLGSKAYPKGIVGLEIETEAIRGYAVPNETDMLKHWNWHTDGSLRNVGMEYIFNQPYTPGKEDYKEALKNFSVLAKSIKFIESTYSSVHVHLNMMDKELKHMINFFCLYFLFEEFLTEYCGDDRNGNLFCLKTSNAEAIYRTVKDMTVAISEGTGFEFIRHLDGNRLKYSGLNVVPIRTQGSAEVRIHPGTTDIERIDRWVNILMLLFVKADTFENPVEIVNRLMGYRSKAAFFEMIFEEYSKYFNLSNIESKFKDGLWYATSVASSVDNWKDFGSKKSTQTSKIDKNKAMRDYYAEIVTAPNQPELTREVVLEQLRQYERARAGGAIPWGAGTIRNTGGAIQGATTHTVIIDDL